MEHNDEKVAEEVDFKDVAAAGISDTDPALDRRLTRKLDVHILPWIFILWLLAFIDRSNIGMPLKVPQLHLTQPLTQG